MVFSILSISVFSVLLLYQKTNFTMLYFCLKWEMTDEFTICMNYHVVIGFN